MSHLVITLYNRLSTRNFNVPMAKASKVTIAEVEEIVETGEIDPDQVHVPGMYVDRVIKGSNYEKALSVSVLFVNNNTRLLSG